MTTLESDIKKVKLLLKQENKKELLKISTLFLPEYNVKLLSHLDPIDRNKLMQLLNYN